MATIRPAKSFELTDLLNVMRTRLGLIVRVTILVVALAAIIVMFLPARFSSSAVVILDQRKNTIADLTSVLSALPTDPASLQNQIQILQSRDLAAEVITKLKLYDDPEFNAAEPTLGGALLSSLNPKRWLSPETDSVPVDGAVRRDAIIDAFLSHLSAESLGLSTTITVTFVGARCQQGRTHRQHRCQHLCRRPGRLEAAGDGSDKRLADAAHPGSFESGSGPGSGRAHLQGAEQSGLQPGRHVADRSPDERHQHTARAGARRSRRQGCDLRPG